MLQFSMMKETRIAIVVVVTVLIVLLYCLWPATPSHQSTSPKLGPDNTLSLSPSKTEAIPQQKKSDNTLPKDITRIIVQPSDAQVDQLNLHQLLSGKVVEDDKVIPEEQPSKQHDQ